MGNRSVWQACAIMIALVWFGAILGHSFVATPAKFMAATLERPVALDVGRATFAVFSKTEWLLCALLAVAILAGLVRDYRRSSAKLIVAIIAGLAAILAVQALWLLPALGERVDLVAAGKPLPASIHHAAYAALELAKAAALLVLAAKGLVDFGRHGAN